MEDVDCIVVGAGVVGLAIASTLAQKGRDVIVLETEKMIGTGISSRNSEVIHAGIYYPQESLKAKLCVRGKELLYRYATERNIHHKKCGKLVVAAHEEQLEKLHEINNRAIANGVTDLRFLSSKEIKDMEPDLACFAALFSPSTGIIDTHELMTSLQGDLENKGGMIAFLTSTTQGCADAAGIELRTISQGEDMNLKARTVINAAGLHAVDFAGKITNFPKDKIPSMRYAKGNYFTFTGKHSFKHLIYPIPEEGGLGVHLTLDLAGKGRFGPDVEWIDTPDYRVDPARAVNFYHAIRSYWPALPDGVLVPDYAGIRPKIFWGETPCTDFLIQDKAQHGIEGLINLFGIESPGLTSALAIAEYVAAKI